MVGAWISARLRGGVDAPERTMPAIWRANCCDNLMLRHGAAFVSGFLVLYGARLAGGCTSGHMMSGMMQTAAPGYIFAAGVIAGAIPVAVLLFRNEAGAMDIILAPLIGGAFGVTLDRVAASNPCCIIGMLNLTNLHLMKAILLAIGVAAALVFGRQMLGLVDIGRMSVKAAYRGVLVGGGLLGVGFAVSGFCPGAALAAAAPGWR